MHEFFFFNRRLTKNLNQYRVAASAAALYGKGIFSTVAIKEKKLFLWEKHWRRLNANASKTDLDISDFSESFLVDAFHLLIKKNKIINGRARITLFDERAGGLWNFETKIKTILLITTNEPRQPEKDFRLTVSPFLVNSTSPLAGVKSCNYLENIFALQDAQRRGFSEAIRLNERGAIASACMANIFWRKDGQLFTPSLKTGCLAGTTREFVLENENGFEVEADLHALEKADEIFLTSAGLGICKISEFDIKNEE